MDIEVAGTVIFFIWENKCGPRKQQCCELNTSDDSGSKFNQSPRSKRGFFLTGKQTNIHDWTLTFLVSPLIKNKNKQTSNNLAKPLALCF